MPDTKAHGAGVRGKNELPGVELPSVPGQEPGSGPSENPVRMFDAEAFLTHYYHLLERRAIDPDARGCCIAGPPEIIREMETVVAEPELVQNTGVDKETTGPSAPGNWWDSR